MGEKLDTTELWIFVSVDRLLRRTQYRGCFECERDLRMEYGAIRCHTWNLHHHVPSDNGDPITGLFVDARCVGGWFVY